MEWRDAAACRDEDPETFFPEGQAGRTIMNQVDDAKAVCRQCPVRRECLCFAVDTGQDFGVWGGLTADERRAVRVKKSDVRTR